jgi:hypothetical protein
VEEHSENNSSRVAPKKLRNKRNLLGILLSVVIILGFVVGVYFIVNNPGQPNTLKNKKVYNEALASYNALPGVVNLSQPDKDKLKNAVQVKYLAAYATGIAPSESEKEIYRGLFGNNIVESQIAKFVNDSIDQKLALAKTTGYYEGYLYYFWYDIVLGGGIEQKNKDYSLSKAREYRDKLINNKVKPEEAIKQIYADKKLKLPDEVNGSGAFAGLIIKPGDTDRDGRYESINKVLYTQSNKGFTDIGNLVADTDYPKTGNKKEVGFFFIEITRVFKGQNDLNNFEQQLQIAKGLVK